MVAYADVFGTSVDALLGHSTDQSDDEGLAVRALMRWPVTRAGRSS